MCDALHYLLVNILIRFSSKLYRQIVGIPMGTNCAPLVADLFLFCYERDFMLPLSDINQTDIIGAFNSTSRYLDDLLNIGNPYFEQMIGQIYPTELQLNKANSSDTEAQFLDLNLSITNGIVSSKIYDKRDDFNFETVNYTFLDGDVPRSPSYGIYISQLIRFAWVCSNVHDFNNRNIFLTANSLKQGNRYHKIQKAFSKFYHRHSELIVKYNIGLKTLLQQGISELIFACNFSSHRVPIKYIHVSDPLCQLQLSPWPFSGNGCQCAKKDSWGQGTRLRGCGTLVKSRPRVLTLHVGISTVWVKQWSPTTYPNVIAKTFFFAPLRYMHSNITTV